jgi:hypothetical protein
MKLVSVLFCAVALALTFVGTASAQGLLIPPGGSILNPPLPAAPPPPRIQVPVIPQLDAPVVRNYAPPPRPSFSDRITSCLDDAAANGLGPSDRATYSRSCANQPQ